uniref:Uncharacterized protein n=1 Tax=Faecalibaculum rodentium TaxID=1702221 RepID=A0A140DRK1_9FIRM|nr:hypothetical protein AALO17_01440 [Faecalibaculum rodentium]
MAATGSERENKADPPPSKAGSTRFNKNNIFEEPDIPEVPEEPR